MTFNKLTLSIMSAGYLAMTPSQSTQHAIKKMSSLSGDPKRDLSKGPLSTAQGRWMSGKEYLTTVCLLDGTKVPHLGCLQAPQAHLVSTRHARMIQAYGDRLKQSKQIARFLLFTDPSAYKNNGRTTGLCSLQSTTCPDSTVPSHAPHNLVDL